MKYTTLAAALLVAMMALSTREAAAADYRVNPFTLAYEGASPAGPPSSSS